MHEMISSAASRRDIEIHAELCAVHLCSDIGTDPSSASSFRDIGSRMPSTSSTTATRKAAIIESSKETLARCLLSFFPTRKCKMKNVSGQSTVCPFWQAASNSISTLLKEALTSTADLPLPPCSEYTKSSQTEYVDHDFNSDENSKNVWNVLHLTVRSGRLDILRYLLNMQQEEKIQDSRSFAWNQRNQRMDNDDANGLQTAGSFQFMKGRRVTADMQSLSLCACYYDQPLSLAVLQDYIRACKNSPLGRQLGINTGTIFRYQAGLSISDDTQRDLKILDKTYFRPLSADISIFELCLSRSQKCLSQLLNDNFSESCEPNSVWSILVKCLQHGFVSENNLIFVIEFLFKNIEMMEREASRKNKFKSNSKKIFSYHFRARDMPLLSEGNKVPDYENVVKLLINNVSIICQPHGVSDRGSICSKDMHKESFFHLCCRRGLTSTVQLLLLYGADVCGTDTKVRFSKYCCSVYINILIFVHCYYLFIL